MTSTDPTELIQHCVDNLVCFGPAPHAEPGRRCFAPAVTTGFHDGEGPMPLCDAHRSVLQTLTQITTAPLIVFTECGFDAPTGRACNLPVGHRRRHDDGSDTAALGGDVSR